MRTGMCWRKADRGYTRQYYCIAGPITQETHIMFESVKELIRDSFSKQNIFMEGMRKPFNGGSEIRMPFNYEAKP